MVLLPTERQSILQVLYNTFIVWKKSFFAVLPFMIVMCAAVATTSFFTSISVLHLQNGLRPLPNKALPLLDVGFIFTLYILYAAMYDRIYTIIYDKKSSLISALIVGIKNVIYLLIATVITLLVLALIVLAICVPFFLALHLVTHRLPDIWPLQQYLMKPRIEFLALLSIILAYIFAAVLLLFYFPLIIVDNLNPFTAFPQSCYLVWGSWWRTAIVVGMLYFVIPLCFIVIQWYFGYHIAAHYLSALNTWILAMAAQNLISLFYVPLYVSAVLVMLHDLKVRKHINPVSSYL